MVCTWGRGGASQSEAGGRPTSIQGETEGAEREQEWREEEGSKKSKDNKDQDDEEEDSNSTSLYESETEEPSKPPAKTQRSTQPSEEDADEGKEGTADDDKPSPRNVEARCKVHEKGERPGKGSTVEHCEGRSASQMARAAGDFGTL